MLRFLTAILVVVMLASPSLAEDEATARRLLQDQVRSAFVAGDFSKLEDWIEEYQNLDVRTASGMQKLVVLYDALNAWAYMYGGTPTYENFARMEAQIDRWLAAKPNSRAARIVRGMTMLNRAWFGRGDTYFNQLSEEQRKAFSRQIADAWRYTQMEKKKAAGDPHWYYVMLSIAMSAGAYQEFEALAKEALHEHPDYHKIHTSIVYRYLPQWRGTYEQLGAAIDMVAAAASTGQRDMVYARAYWSLIDHFPEQALLYYVTPDWPRFVSGFRKINRLYPSDRNLNGFARMACLGQDRALTKELLTALANAVEESEWFHKDQIAFCRDWASQPLPPPPPDMYVVQVYSIDVFGRAMPAYASSHENAEAAVAKARELAPKHQGVVAYKLEPNPNEARSYKRPIVLFSAGKTPDSDSL